MQEPVRKSFLDMVKRNLSLADRYALTTRIIYIGEYKGSHSDLQTKFRENVKMINEEYGSIVFSGLLLVYPRFFLHLIEASEKLIYRHLTEVLEENLNGILGCIIPLPLYHNVHRIYFSEWYTVFILNAPSLLDSIGVVGLAEIQKQIRNCLLKMYLLSEYLLNTGQKSYGKTNEALRSLDKVVPHFLPEITIAEYLLDVQSPILQDIRVYVEEFKNIPSVNFYNDRIWPPAVSSLIPCALELIDGKRE